MDKLFSPMRRDGIATPRKENAHVQNGLNNQTNVALDYTAPTPKKLSMTRLSAYWVEMMGEQKNG
jgi:hypothetical protein